ncbi:MAG: polyribonucleotide nucleotidyltransferase [Candidatus Doudnabacteria bacterium RIFCSPHIGHO2_01_FULL_50_67]|nr:MAG: polyribonucleotide nucleotidyltransferase [Candidatus Doudnabacteria bacterium RIFCSPHIGHO2_01_FULL_50_67]
MNTNEYTVTADIGGKSWKLSAGKFAPQSSGSVVIRVGDTMVMATVVMGNKPREGIDYLPLLVDYEEKLYAAGKIKGSRWVKREGRPSDEAILSGRVIDRSLRPMFDGRIRLDIQVVVTVLSVDGENDPDVLGLSAASAAVAVSDIPWDGPIAGVRVGRIEDKFVLNPSFASIENGSSDLDLIVSGTGEHIIMVEAGAKEVSEEDIIAGCALAQSEIAKILEAVKSLSAKVGRPKREIPLFAPSEEVRAKLGAYDEEYRACLFVPNLAERDAKLSAFRDKAVAEVAGEDDELKRNVNYILDETMKKLVQKGILDKGQRVDGRGLDEIRAISCEVGFLPRVHGSGLFRRGETQVLTTVTLGGPGDEQLLEDLDTEEERKKRYMHHYNMPGFASGEVKPLRSPGRREIGHGALAERALLPMIPPKETFPYTLRLVSEVLSSNGSTSMASTCGSTLALMDAGIPILSPVAGIAMGLVLDKESGKYKVLTDILGLEDGNGHMDFKVAGTKKGITALQLDIKVKGLTKEILKDALATAKNGRLTILEKMLQAIAAPRAEMSPYAPRIVSFKINPDKIREVIGPGGKVINGIIAETGVKIDIEDDGTVMVTSTNAEASQKAVDWIKNLIREVQAGEVFQGTITRILDFGAFAEILPGQEGLIHISELEPHRVEKVTDVVKVGDIVPVKVINIDELGRINLSRKALLPGAENQPQEFNSRPPRSGGGGHRPGGRPHGGPHRGFGGPRH